MKTDKDSGIVSGTNDWAIKQGVCHDVSTYPLGHENHRASETGLPPPHHLRITPVVQSRDDDRLVRLRHEPQRVWPAPGEVRLPYIVNSHGKRERRTGNAVDNLVDGLQKGQRQLGSLLCVPRDRVVEVGLGGFGEANAASQREPVYLWRRSASTS